MQKGITSTPPSYLKRSDFPSITGKPADGPMFPRPNIAVPSVTIAAILLVLLNTLSFFVRALKFF